VNYGNASQVSQRFEQSGGDIACIMVTPYDWESEPEASYLQHLRQLSDDHGTLLIFDEVLTGFRLAMGGSQEYFKIDADLAVFGKALANGYPLSALTGKREIMREMEKIFVTSTHAGELASIAAALATLEKLDRCNVVKDIEEKGDLLMEGICSIFKELDIPGKVVGLPAGFNVSVGDADSTGLEAAFVKRLFANGLFWDYRVSLCYSHSRSDIDETLLRIKTAAREARG